MQKFLAAPDSYTNICEDFKLSTVQQQQLHRLQQQYITSMVANVEARFPRSSPLLAALKIFDPLAVPESSELGFNVYGNRDISTLAQHFYQSDDEATQKTRSSKLLAEWHQMKFNIYDKIKPNIPIAIKTGKSSTTSTQWFPSQLMKAKSEYQPFFGELLLIADAAITLPVSNAWPERGASALKIVKNRCRSHLQNDMFEVMLHQWASIGQSKDGVPCDPSCSVVAGQKEQKEAPKQARSTSHRHRSSSSCKQFRGS